MSELLLFDDLKRSSTEPALYGEGMYDYLNRTAREDFAYVRELLEGWFENYNADEIKRRQIRTEFRSGENIKHLNAFFEIYLYQLFKQLDFEVKIEPTWQVNQPDFLLTSPSGDKILVEASGIFSDFNFGVTRKLEAQLMDYLDKSFGSGDFYFHLHWISSSNRSLPLKKIMTHLSAELKKLDHNHVVKQIEESNQKGYEKYPSTTWQDDNWHIQFFFIPKKELDKGKSGMRSVGSTFRGLFSIDGISPIRNKLIDKYRHYGNLDIPFILVLNVFEFCEDETIYEALYGTEVLNLYSDNTYL